MSISFKKLAAGLAVAGLSLTACGGGESAPASTTVLLQKNSALGKACGALPTKKARNRCRDAEKKAEETLTGAGNSVANAVAKEYKNASNQVVDAAGTVMDAIPTSWPNELSLEAVAPLFGDIVGQVKGIIPSISSQLKSALDKAAADFDTLEADEAESRINAILATPGKIATKAIPIPGFAKLIAPYTTPIKVKVKPNLDKDKGLKGLDWN